MSEEQPPSQHAIGSYIAQADRGSTARVNVNVFNNPPSSFVDPRDRSNLLEVVQSSWIAGVLTTSINQTLPIQLNKEIKVGVIERSEAARLAALHQQSSAIPSNKKILEIFEEMGRALLILGGPGSGKTMTMLQLASEAITFAEQDSSQPIPVIFNLSSWTNPKQSIIDWLVGELRTKYAIPLKIARLLLEKDALLVLLDGLDEVKPELQQACVAAINHYHAEHMGGLVVCCRKDEYETIINQHKIKLRLGGAIMLHPLTLQQIDEYLTHAGPTLSALRTAIQKEMILQELAQSPLMLSIMCVVYQNIAADTLITEQLPTSPDTLQKQLFDTYVERMFRQRISRTFGSRELEILEEGSNKQSKNISYSREQTLNWLSWLAYKMSQRGQAVFLIEQMQPNWFPSWKMYWIYVVSVGLSVGVIVLLAFWLFFQFLGQQLVIESLSYPLLPVVFCVTFVISAWRAQAKIEMVEVLHWSWNQYKNKKKIVWLILLGWLFIYALPLIFFLVGLSYGQIEKKIRPGQGIRQSAKNALIMGVFSLLIFPMVFEAFIALVFVFADSSRILVGLQYWLMFALILAPPVGIIVGLYCGGFACIKHLMLRLVLSLNHFTPWNYVHFLDYTVERILLRNIGGGYIFIHGQMQAYFATKYNPIMESASSQNTSRFLASLLRPLANLLTKKLLRILFPIGLGLGLLGGTTMSAVSYNNAIFYGISFFFYAIGVTLAAISWIGALIKTAQSRQWVWFVCLLFFTYFAMLVYIFVGPEIPGKMQSHSTQKAMKEGE